CPECTGHWVLFQKTCTVLSQSGETEISVERSQQMWLACVEHVHKKAPALNAQSEVVPISSRSDASQPEGDRQSPSASPRWLDHLTNLFTPRLGYALAGAAALALGAAYLTPTPQNAAPRVVQTQNLPPMPTANGASFATPPRATTGMIDYHSAMAFEPFSNHVAPTLVSTTATRP
ncbi:MAG: hypothetical protein KY445_15565, partial [Armatimonadetes bacterium]|nr:hypothetical protein [Armatimonadota bacterium]